MRVVTLDGEIINSAGAITGGRYRNKTADILQRKAEIRALQEDIQKKENHCYQVKQEFRRHELKLLLVIILLEFLTKKQSKQSVLQADFILPIKFNIQIISNV